MDDRQCIRFLQEWLPRLGLRWEGYRKVRRTVCKRIARRVRALGLADATAYARHLDAHAEERERLQAFCRIPISRFYRDRAVYRLLERELLPKCAAAARQRGDDRVRCWSAGCASGEEPYTVRIVWDLAVAAHFPDVTLEIVATDADAVMLARAETAVYRAGSLKELPDAYRKAAFGPADGNCRLKPAFRSGVRFECQDIRTDQPDGSFDIVFCRNLVFTYFDAASQRFVLRRVLDRLRPGGIFVIGAHERLPGGGTALRRVSAGLPVYRYDANEDV